MIQHVKNKKRLVELASTIWEYSVPDKKQIDLLDEILRSRLYAKVLDVVPECRGYSEGKKLIACSLWGKDGRSVMLPVLIPSDEYKYEFKNSLNSANDLKSFGYKIHDNPGLVLMLFPSERNCILVLEKHGR